jgi:hypothetical protein
MISEMTENASSNPASGVTQGSRRNGSTCAINRWLVLGSGAGSGVGWTGRGPEEATGGVCRGTSILAIPFFESGMLTNYRDESPFFNLPLTRPVAGSAQLGRNLPEFGALGATSTMPWSRFDFSFALISQ